MTNEDIEFLKKDLRTNTKFWLFAAAGFAIMIAAVCVPVNSDLDLETLGRVSNILLGGMIVMNGYLIRHASKIDELDGRVEALEEDPKE